RHLFFFSSRRRHTRFSRDWSSDVCSSDLHGENIVTPPVLQIAYNLSIPAPRRGAGCDLTNLNKSNMAHIVRSEQKPCQPEGLSEIGRASCRERGEMPRVGVTRNEEGSAGQ